MKTVISFRVWIGLITILIGLGFAAPTWSQTYNFRAHEDNERKTAQEIKEHDGLFDTIVVRHDKWLEMAGLGNSWTDKLKFKSVHAFVKFYVNHAYPVKILQPYTLRLAYRIYGYGGNMNDTLTPIFAGYDTLTISYKPDSLAAFQDIQYKKYSNFHKIMVVMTDLFKITGANSAPVAQNLSLNGGFSLLNFTVEASILTQAYNKKVRLAPNSYADAYGADAPVLDIASESLSGDHLPVRWNLDNVSPLSTPIPFTPVNYELEWTYVDNYKVNPANGSVSTIQPTSLQYNFKDNSTRIWLDTNYYRIPLIYQKGYLVYRVRAIRPDSVQYQYPIYGPWTLLADNGTVSSVGLDSKCEIQAAHLNDSLNWQYTVSFAEQGKYKHVMSYYDGMLKNRQSITRFNSTPDRLIATEQVYDYEGRPSISVLPTPVSSLAFRYQFNLTLNAASGLPYKASDFDGLQGSVCPIDSVPPKLADGSPAHQYYSPANSDTTDFQKFVPDAGGYPFVQTVYSPGYDERVEKQGGAGDTLQIGRNHTVKNDYVSAEQMDLNRLFGIDIGWSGFYRKTVSRDPNGQLSLNVTDYRGKTVTSSMVGIPDTALHAIVPNDNVPDTSFYQEDHIAGTAQQVIGNKRILDKNFFNDAGGNNLSQYIYSFSPYETFCQGKYLSVEARYDYSIFDECGALKVDTGGSLGSTGVLTSPATLSDTSEQVSFYMEKGKHSLHKELTINTDDVASAVDEFMKLRPEENCLKTEPWFIKQAVLSKEFPCPEYLPNLDCGTCEGKKYQMMQELWPNKDSMYIVRKYGVYRNINDSIMGNTNSIFTPFLTIIPDPNDPELTLYIRKYRYQDTCLVQLPASVTKFGRTYTNLKSLPVDTFIYIFNDKIAEALLPLHPEYCKLLECVEDNFASRLRSIPDADVAEQLGLFRLDDIIAADPIFLRMQTMPLAFPNPHDTLAFTINGLLNLDTMALIHAYCNCQDSTMMSECYTNTFSQQIQNGILNNNYVKQRYFEFVRDMYIGNRNRYKFVLNPLNAGLGSCSTCVAARMKLVPIAIFPDLLDGNGNLATGSGSILAAVQTVNPPAGNTLSGYFSLMQQVDPDSLATFQDLNDSAFTVYTNYNSTLCEAPVSQIIAQLVNCADSLTLLKVRDTLLKFCQNGLVLNGNYTPELIRRAIVNNFINPDDLCNPYLINYDNTMTLPVGGGQGLFACNSDLFYTYVAATLNGSTVKGVLANPGSSSTFTYNSINQFDQAIRIYLGGVFCNVSAAYNASQHLYTLTFERGGNKVKMHFKTAASGACSNAFAVSPGESVSIGVQCINETIFSGFARGYIGKYAFATVVTRTSGGNTTQCLLPSWSDKIEMNSEAGNPIAQCVPCTQMRGLYAAFRDTLVTYKVKGLNHPYYNTMLRNFMNYKLRKAYTEDQYRTFVESCALADSFMLPRYAGYYVIGFNSGNHCQDFIDAVNSYDPAVHITISYHYRTTGSEAINFTLEEVPKHKLRKMVTFIANYYNTHTSVMPGFFPNYRAPDPGFLGYLWLPDTTSFFPGSYIFGGMPNSPTFNQHPLSFTYWNGVAFQGYKDIEVWAPSGATPAQQSYAVSRLQQYLYEHNITGHYYPLIEPTVNSQYTLAEKKAYLQYTYQYQSQPPNKVLDSLQTRYLEPGIGLFNDMVMSYGHPAQPGNITNLYYADSTAATLGTQYARLQYIINKVKTALTNNKLFFSGNATRNISVPAGELLTAYRCRDTAFWYRYFGTGDTLYNVFLRLPAYLDTSVISGYEFRSMTFNLGEGNSYSFKVNLENINAPVRFITLNGYTDFVVAKNNVLKDVLMAYAVNETIPVADTVNNCERQRLNAAIYEGKIKYKLYVDSIRERLTSDFYAYIMNGGIQEKLYVGYRNQRFNYTLYYYDRAGNLMRTIPPAGMVPLANTYLTDVNVYRADNNTSSLYQPQHHKRSDYQYNSINQVQEQETPDGGRTEYFYDAAGRAIFSQNEKQRQTGNMTYTLYDPQGRIVETGQAKLSCAPYFEPYPWPTSLSSDSCSYYINGEITPFPPVVHNLRGYSHNDVIAYVRSLTREEVVLTHYDTAAINLAAAQGMSAQENLRKRVSCIKYFDFLQPSDATFSNYDYAMHFSYDIAGNVKTLTRDYPVWKINRQQFKRIDYDYDVISGKVNMLSYNRSFADQYFQRYGYDSDNRIIEVKTSADGYLWKRDAAYRYYKHGPLARMSLGDLRVQGVDYAYTIQGWLKAVNGDMLNTASDMGRDAVGTSVHTKDAVALSLDYFKGDYRPIGGVPVTHIADPVKNMYNGNIPRATTSIAPFPALNTRYEYDQLNRIMKAQYAYVNPYDATMTNTADYYSKYAYDPDGNLKKLVRNGNAVGGNSQLMDSLEYHYLPNAPNNRLQNVTDYVTNTFHNDIKHYTNTGASRYLYDATGNTIKDQVSGQDTILWNHYNKVTLTRRDSLGNNLDFAYDGAGNRFLKTVVRQNGDTTLERSDYYVRDAQGNILAIYDAESRYEMTKSEWVQYVTTKLVIESSLSGFLNGVIVAHYAQQGHFKNSVLQTAMASPAFMSLIADHWPVSFFVRNSRAVKQNILSHAGDYSEYYSKMRNYTAATGQPLLAASLYNTFARDDQRNEDFLTALFDSYVSNSMQKHVLELLCSHTDSLMVTQLHRMGIEYDTASCAVNAQKVLDQFAGNPGALGQFSREIAKAVTYNGYGPDYWNFLQAFALDATVMEEPKYIDKGGTLIGPISQAMIANASDSVLGAFFDTWGEATVLLRTTTPQSTRMQIAYDGNPAALLESYINNQAGGQLGIVTDGLIAIPWLNPADYLDVWGGSGLVIIDTIITTIYENILHSRRISLASHHLYGSSRLGTKDYLAGEYYLNWDYSGPQPISDTVTLTARRPWYSLEYNDNISGLAQQPWAMTDVSAYQAGHTLGKKQYELTNHLGNVQATISDYPAYRQSGTGDTIRERNPALVTAYDYYPFGMLMPGRGTDSLSSISNVLSNILLLYTDFSDGTHQGWNPGNGTSIENGRMRVDVQGPWHGTTRDIVLTPGKQYRARVNYDAGTMITAGPTYMAAINGNNGVNLAVTGMFGSGTGYEVNFIAPSASFVRFAITTPNTTPTGINVTYYIDNFILEEIKPQAEVPPVIDGGCMTLTQSKWVTVWETVCQDVNTWVWPGYEILQTGKAQVSGGMLVITANTSGDGVSFGQTVVPGVWQTLTLSVNRIVSGSGLIQVLEEQNGVMQSLGIQSFNHAGEIKLTFKPTNPYITYQILGPVITHVDKICFDKPVLKQENILVDICPEVKDRYRFGFNGQEKINEWAGIGNFMDYKERGQDTRIARFLSIDPLMQKFPYLTPFQFASNSPIQAVDLDGLEGVRYTDVERKKITVIVDMLYVKEQGKKSNNNTWTDAEIGRVKSNLDKELNKTKFKDSKTGYDVIFQITFKPVQLADLDKNDAVDDIYNPSVALRYSPSTIVSQKTVSTSDGMETKYTGRKEGTARWRRLTISNSRNSHNIAHETFHNLTHAHKNAPERLKKQIDPQNQAPGHNAAGGIFTYGNEETGQGFEDINQKNVQDMLETLPEANQQVNPNAPATAPVPNPTPNPTVK